MLEEVRVAGAAPGEPGTFDAYVRERSVALQRFAFLVTHDSEDARDAVQDALTGLYPRWERVRAGGNVDAYVRRSIVNASVSRWRRTRRTVPVESPEDWERTDDPGFADGLADADEAWRLCGELPVPQRAAVVLRFWEDRTYAEIAEVLGCTEATARSHVHRALARLRIRLAEGGPR